MANKSEIRLWVLTQWWNGTNHSYAIGNELRSSYQQSTVGFLEYATGRTIDPLHMFLKYWLKRQTRIFEDSSIALSLSEESTPFLPQTTTSAAGPLEKVQVTDPIPLIFIPFAIPPRRTLHFGIVNGPSKSVLSGVIANEAPVDES